MKVKRVHVFLIGLLITILLLPAAACKSAPKTPPAETAVVETSPPPTPEALDAMNAAMARAADARESVLEVQGQVYFPDEWNKAESENNAGKNANKDTADGVSLATASFVSAADGYEAIAENSGPLFAKDMEDARIALQTAVARADQSRNDALGSNGQIYFPDEWEAAEAMYLNSAAAQTATLAELNAAAALYNASAEAFEAIAEDSRPLFAGDKANIQKTLDEAMARADQSRKDAQAAQANTLFAADWRNAEAQLQSGKNAKKGTVEEMTAAAALFAAAADSYDALTAKSRPMLEKNNAEKDLNAAMARADKSRQAAMAVDGQTYFPNDWKNAETKNTSAKNAKKTTAEEIRAATALYVSAADAYDLIAKNSGTRFTKDKDDATKALNTAIARADKSKKDATDAKGQANFPNEWKNAETKNQNARNAKRGTPAEMKAAVTLFNSAADAYDDIVRKSNEKLAQTAKAQAEKERKEAIDVRANIAVKDDFNKADAVFNQAQKDFTAKSYPQATDRFNQSATQFAAAAQAAGGKRVRADDAVARAKQRSDESVAFAVNTGITMEDENDEE